MKIKKLDEICIEQNFYFSINLLGNFYCQLGVNGHEVDCPYFGKKDENNFHICTYFNKTEEIVDLN